VSNHLDANSYYRSPVGEWLAAAGCGQPLPGGSW